ncbi:hypothetical protein BD779DRAFT_1548473 [Infundibulicybe gibba]|nr:hypothetical protein BD779DRAFT_1548473 [Infundibulicybe gibba]
MQPHPRAGGLYPPISPYFQDEIVHHASCPTRSPKTAGFLGFPSSTRSSLAPGIWKHNVEYKFLAWGRRAGYRAAQFKTSKKLAGTKPRVSKQNIGIQRGHQSPVRHLSGHRVLFTIAYCCRAGRAHDTKNAGGKIVRIGALFLLEIVRKKKCPQRL